MFTRTTLTTKILVLCNPTSIVVVLHTPKEVFHKCTITKILARWLVIFNLTLEMHHNLTKDNHIHVGGRGRRGEVVIGVKGGGGGREEERLTVVQGE